MFFQLPLGYLSKLKMPLWIRLSLILLSWIGRWWIQSFIKSSDNKESIGNEVKSSNDIESGGVQDNQLEDIRAATTMSAGNKVDKVNNSSSEFKEYRQQIKELNGNVERGISTSQGRIRPTTVQLSGNGITDRKEMDVAIVVPQTSYQGDMPITTQTTLPQYQYSTKDQKRSRQFEEMRKGLESLRQDKEPSYPDAPKLNYKNLSHKNDSLRSYNMVIPEDLTGIQEGILNQQETPATQRMPLASTIEKMQLSIDAQPSQGTTETMDTVDAQEQPNNQATSLIKETSLQHDAKVEATKSQEDDPPDQPLLQQNRGISQTVTKNAIKLEDSVDITAKIETTRKHESRPDKRNNLDDNPVGKNHGQLIGQVRGESKETSLEQKTSLQLRLYNQQIKELNGNVERGLQLNSIDNKLKCLERKIQSDKTLKPKERKNLDDKISRCWIKYEEKISTFQGRIRPTTVQLSGNGITDRKEMNVAIVVPQTSYQGDMPMTTQTTLPQYQFSTKGQERSRQFEEMRNGSGSVRQNKKRSHPYATKLNHENLSHKNDLLRSHNVVISEDLTGIQKSILNQQETPATQRMPLVSTIEKMQLSIDAQPSQGTTEAMDTLDAQEQQDNQATGLIKETCLQPAANVEETKLQEDNPPDQQYNATPSPIEQAEKCARNDVVETTPKPQEDEKYFFCYEISTGIKWYRDPDNRTLCRVHPNGERERFSEILLSTEKVFKKDVAYFKIPNGETYRIYQANGEIVRIDLPDKRYDATSSPTEKAEKYARNDVVETTPKVPETEILDLAEHFVDEFKDYSDKHTTTFMVKVKEKAESYIPKIEEFSGTNYSVEYFVIYENLMMLIETLDKISCQQEPEVFAKKIEAINCIKELIKQLDSRVVHDS